VSGFVTRVREARRVRESGDRRAGLARPRGARGAVAVEAALMLSVILMPLMLGVFYYGYFLWKAQSQPLLDPNVDQAAFVGDLCGPELLARVRDTVLVTATNLDDGTHLPISLSDITATLVDPLATGTLGVDVRVSISAPVLQEKLSFLPLPNNGRLVSDALIRLENVRLKTAGCT
jgi:hypothetical protein